MTNHMLRPNSISAPIAQGALSYLKRQATLKQPEKTNNINPYKKSSLESTTQNSIERYTEFAQRCRLHGRLAALGLSSVPLKLKRH